MGPPENVLPGIGVLDLLLLHDDRRACRIGVAEVYPTGVEFLVELRGHEPAPPGVETGVGTWRFGVQFADGRKATAYGLGMMQLGAGSSTTVTATTRGGSAMPEGPLLRSRGGGGSRSVFRQQYWLWPLPPPGDLIIACEWPNLGVELRTATMSADLIRDAADRAHELWPAPDVPDWPGS